MRSLGVSRGLLRSRGVSWGLMRHHGVSQDFTVSHVLLLIEKPRLEVVAIETVETAGTIGDEHALDGTCGTALGPHLGPSLQGALADRERLLGGDDQRFLNCDRGVLADLDRISRGLVRPVRILRWHEVILATGRRQGMAYPHRRACDARQRAADRRDRSFVFPQFVVPTKRIRIDDCRSKFVKTSEHRSARAVLHRRARSAMAVELPAWSRMHCYPYPQQNITIHPSPPSSAIIYECSIHLGRRGVSRPL